MFCALGRRSRPVHGAKKRGSDVVLSYEKVPRKMARMEEKEVIHLLPIKDKTGLILRSVEKGTALWIRLAVRSVLCSNLCCV